MVHWFGFFTVWEVFASVDVKADSKQSEVFGNSYNGYNINSYANPAVTWEVAEKTNLGLELGLFDDMNIQIDYFTENRTNIYMWRDYIPATMGLTAPIASNIGKAESHGIDGSADYKVSINKDLWITSRVNFTYANIKRYRFESEIQSHLWFGW